MNDVIEIVRKEILKEDNWGKDDLAIERFHPSESGKCERQIFLSKIRAKTFSERIRASMEVGTILHRYVQKLWDIKEFFDIEVQVKTDVPDSKIYFRGNADLVAKDKSVVIDLKAINGLSYVKDNPMTEHIYQLMVYMKGLEIPNGEIIYINKGDLEMVRHKIDLTSEIRLNKAYAKVKAVYEALKIWDAQPRWDKIPFPKDSCYHCRSEMLDPQFKKLLEGEE